MPVWLAFALIAAGAVAFGIADQNERWLHETRVGGAAALVLGSFVFLGLCGVLALGYQIFR